MRWGLDSGPRPAEHHLVRALFIRALALIYLIAFVSFGVQSAGLIGSEGILPAAEYLDRGDQALAFGSYWRVPTVLRLNSSDVALNLVAVAGAALSLVLLAGFIQKTALVLLYILYLSIVSAGQVFMSYQWDALLLEAGFLAIGRREAPERRPHLAFADRARLPL